MRLTVNVADICVELDDVANPTIEGVETLLNRVVGAALLAYAGLVDIDSLSPASDDEEEPATPDDE